MHSTVIVDDHPAIRLAVRLFKVVGPRRLP